GCFPIFSLFFQYFLRYILIGMNQNNFSTGKTMMQIIDDASLGGAENHTRLISKEFARRGYKIVLICPPGPYVEKFRELEGETDTEVVECPHISKHYMNPLRGFDLYSLIKSIKLIRECIKSNEIGVIHSHKHPVDLLIALSTNGLKGLKIITTIHSMDNKDKFWIWRWWRYFFIKYALSKFDYIFAVSENVRINTINYFSLTPRKVVTMMNGVDLSELSPVLSKKDVYDKYKVLDNQFVIVCTGKLEYRKGQDILLRAVASIINSKKYQQDVVVLLAGTSNPDFQDKLQLLAGELNIEGKVKLVGHVNNIADVLQIAHLYIQPSRWDPLPRALIEAMGMGIPSIGSNVDGIQELIEHHKTGLLFENGVAEDLALQIKKAIDSPELREFWGEESIKKVKKQHTTHNMADTIENYLLGEEVENLP
ncbi:MAG: glycosyltransferase family 4 protein, partial [Thermodesulfobacteriota bacterium]